MTLVLAIVVAAVWAGLALARGGFWRFRERDEGPLPDRFDWPAVAIVVPARDEADVIARTVAGLLAQDYPGAFRVIVIDDASSDGTAAAARGVPDVHGRLRVVAAPPRAAGWTGKLWALDRGIATAGYPKYFWLTDADIGHAPDNLRRLVARAEAGHLALVSLMARLNCDSLAERALIPAFVYFFALLYPFGRVNDVHDRLAGAAGGCVLVRRDLLAASGGLAGIRGALIDDCSLAAQIKPYGPLWLGLSRRAVSLRPYAFNDIRRMVARSAYAQLGFSPVALAATLAGLALVYLAPPGLALFASGTAQALGAAAWLVMAVTLLPILRFYGASPLWAPALPLIALTYAGFTLDSAVQHWRGRGGMWKGRAQAPATQ